MAASRGKPYLIAAKRLFDHSERFSCMAVLVAGGDAGIFTCLFAPNARHIEVFWLDYAADAGRIDYHNMQEWRVMACCFAAAMAETGDLYI
jgi:hypothetical protein